MSKLTMILALILCGAVVILPLWASWKGVGESSVTTEKDQSTGRILYVGSRGWVGGGPSAGK
ncbi:hypothetical protein EOL70_12785 [Leucothrix sargassi]|nr:hypothetical protein EOL70_12785 [Leucothrix sargassi]